jgi:glucose/arabinose dehydrogenase
MTNASVGAQDDYPPGTLTPALDLNLQTVEVKVPEQFRDSVPEGLTLNVPQGFSVSVFMAGLRNPRLMVFDDNGVLHVGNMGRGQILALPDRDQDGIADESIVALSGLVEGHSLVFYKGDLYVGEENQIIRARDNDGDLVYEEKEVFISDIPWEGWHDTRTIVFDETNEKLYVSVGSPCDLCRMEEGLQVVGNSSDLVPFSPERGTILQFNADGTGRRIFATGVRNVIGMAFHPVTNELWDNNNGHDLEGRTRPPEWIDVIRDNDVMGYPLVQSHQVWNDFAIPEYQKLLPITREDSLLVARQKKPAGLVPAHYAPMGLHFYSGDQFPEMYKNAAFVAFRAGKAKLSSHPGYNVSALFSDADGSNGRIGEFITGFQTGTTQNSVWGFPVGLTTDQEGSLYVTSDRGAQLILKVMSSPISGTWQHNLPDTLTVGNALEVQATVQIDRLDLEGGTPQLTADLSALGGPAAVPLVDAGDNTYRIDTHLDLGAVPTGVYPLRVLIQQEADDKVHRFELVKHITILSIRGTWENNLPDAVTVGTVFEVQATVQIDRLSAEGGTPQLTADLSALGGPAAVPLVEEGDNTYRIDTRLDLEGLPTGVYPLRVLIQQEVGGRVYRFELVKHITILPLDLFILDDGLTPGWRLIGEKGAQVLGTTSNGPVFNGQMATAVQVEPKNFFTYWSLELQPPTTVPRLGFAGLRFAFHPGNVEKPAVPILTLFIDDIPVDLARTTEAWGIDVERREWQTVEVPFQAFDIKTAYRDGLQDSVDAVPAVRLEGNLNGTFYLDDVRLVTAIPSAAPSPPITAVLEGYSEALPGSFALEQNYPNPFNSATVIGYSLPREASVDLTVYNMVGQEVAKLVYGRREAGVYSVHWDGRDNADRELATGMYVYRLRAGEQTVSRKLLLLR